MARSRSREEEAASLTSVSRSWSATFRYLIALRKGKNETKRRRRSRMEERETWGRFGCASIRLGPCQHFALGLREKNQTCCFYNLADQEKGEKRRGEARLVNYLDIFSPEMPVDSFREPNKSEMLSSPRLDKFLNRSSSEENP